MENPNKDIKYFLGMNLDPSIDKAPKTPYVPNDAPTMTSKGKI